MIKLEVWKFEQIYRNVNIIAQVGRSEMGWLEGLEAVFLRKMCKIGGIFLRKMCKITQYSFEKCVIIEVKGDMAILAEDKHDETGFIGKIAQMEGKSAAEAFGVRGGAADGEDLSLEGDFWAGVL